MDNRYLPYITPPPAMPWVIRAAGLHAAALRVVSHLHLSPAVFCASADATSVELFRSRLPVALPVARVAKVDTVKTRVVLVDARASIVDPNPAAQPVLDFIPSVRSQTGRGHRHHADGLPSTRSHR
jgi:hypothetical protein